MSIIGSFISAYDLRDLNLNMINKFWLISNKIYNRNEVHVWKVNVSCYFLMISSSSSQAIGIDSPMYPWVKVTVIRLFFRSSRPFKDHSILQHTKSQRLQSEKAGQSQSIYGY